MTCERPAFSFGYWLGTHSPIRVWYLYLHLVAFLWSMHGRDSGVRRLSPTSKKKAKATNLGVVFGNKKCGGATWIFRRLLFCDE